MSKNRLKIFFFCIFFIGIVQISGARNMQEIGFDIGKNIRETARISTAAGFTVQNVDGLIMYDAEGLSSDILARYKRPGYEISISPIFSFSMYADERTKDGLAVQTAALQASTRAIKSHEVAQEFVKTLVMQFRKGRWTRYLDNLCPAVTGRSSILNEDGEVAQMGACALDPEYNLSLEEWKKLMMSTQNYKWIGDGVLAKLTVGYNDFGRGLNYSIDLDFEDFELKKRRDEIEKTRRMVEGDQKGWKSTEKYLKQIAATKARIAVLENNAVKRGDKLIPR